MSDLDDIDLTTLRGEHTRFGAFTDKVVLVVNVASRCGLAPQYEKLEQLQKTYGERGFTVVGFPSNQFLQELGSSEAGEVLTSGRQVGRTRGGYAGYLANDLLA